ncbi:MAG: hypothetical protein LUG18_12970 [Candidatus Azobacteroides sp.]|nr:hypothetical protein [Candidatus Azobacteroides sp.]
MKKNFFLLFIMLVSSLAGFAQTKKTFDHDAYQAEKEKIIQGIANLSPEEAKAFFPLYHEMSHKLYEMNRSLRREMRRLSQAGHVSDAEYQKYIEEQFKVKQQQLNIEKEYYSKFKQILSPEKLFKVSVAESRMVKEMLRKQEKK